MLFLMKSVKFSASWRRAGLGKTALTHCPSPRGFTWLKGLGTSKDHRGSPAACIDVWWGWPLSRWGTGLQAPRPGRLIGLGHMDRVRGGIKSIKNPFFQIQMFVGQNPVSSFLEGQDVSYLGILSSTSTGHQPKISQVFTVLLKGTHLPVRIPVAREQSPGSQPMVDFCSMVAERQDESRTDSQWGTA